MTRIILRDPYREMVSLRNTMSRLADDNFYNRRWTWNPNAELALDVVETEEEYLVKASVPGINPDDLDITFTDKILTIKGEYKEEEEKEDVHYHLRERRFGSFSRRLRLPNTIKSDAIEANYEDGVLILHLPKTEEVKPKRITVQNGETPVLEGQASDMASNKN